MRASHTRCARFAALLLLAVAGLGGCATQTSTRTTVVLLPDEDGKVGAVSVSTPSGTQLLDQAFSYSTGHGAREAPSAARTVSRGLLETAYGALLKAQPQHPRTFVLNFLLDKSELTDASKALLPALFAALREHKPATVTVFGHADATGTQERNLKLSADRAEAAAQLLRTNDPTLNNIELQFFGDTKPLTPSGARGSEARNRRVEILVY